MITRNEIEKRIIELLNEGKDGDTTRDIVCKEFSLNHGNYVHYFVRARQQMLRNGR